jgi:putative transcriptional regulator
MQEERERQGLSLQKLGAISGVSRTAIALIEKGERNPSLMICLRLADALGLDLAEVLKSVPAKKTRRK